MSLGIRLRWLVGKLVCGVVGVMVRAWSRPASWLDRTLPVRLNKGDPDGPIMLGDKIGFLLMRSDRRFVSWIYAAEHPSINVARR